MHFGTTHTVVALLKGEHLELVETGEDPSRSHQHRPTAATASATQRVSSSRRCLAGTGLTETVTALDGGITGSRPKSSALPVHTAHACTDARAATTAIRSGPAPVGTRPCHAINEASPSSIASTFRLRPARAVRRAHRRADVSSVGPWCESGRSTRASGRKPVWSRMSVPNFYSMGEGLGGAMRRRDWRFVYRLNRLNMATGHARRLAVGSERSC